MVGGIQPYPSTTMKKAIITCLALCLCAHSLRAEDSLNDQLRRAAEKLKNEFSKVKEQGEIKGREWYKKAKDHVTTSRAEYLQQAGTALTGWKADIDVLKDQGGRDYFKTRIAALEQHHAFAVKELETLTAITDEAQFRARQKSFDRTLWTLEAAVEQAQEEAGL
jgi:uncharacterized coiled-coil protein SlyX